MSTPVDVVRSFYSDLASDNPGKVMSLMATDVEWVTAHALERTDDGLRPLFDFLAQALKGQFSRGWVFKMGGRGPQEILEYVLRPLLEKGARFVPSTVEFKTEDDKIVWLGGFTNANNPTEGLSDSAYAHVFKIKGEKITQILQVSYALPVQEGNLQ
jgi:hypothetical protein